MVIMPEQTEFKVFTDNQRKRTLILVDDLIPWQTKTTGQAARWFGNGKPSCHMFFAGDNIAEFHGFARRIGLFEKWFQKNDSWPHYDLTPHRRGVALALGAIAVNGRTLAKMRMDIRRAMAGKPIRIGDPQLEEHERIQRFVEASTLLRAFFDDNGKPIHVCSHMDADSFVLSDEDEGTRWTCVCGKSWVQTHTEEE